jgi:pimeloyl-ACP methyl ester carboxylesterase
LPAIPCPRDLEDYFRLWTPGVAALMKVLPANYTVQLTLSGSGQIRIFQAVEPNGGTNYLFDETTASNQVANSTSLYVGLLTSSSPIIFNVSTNFNEHFIFCGAAIGSAQIDLQVLDGNGNVIADAPTYLQIKDIKQMYERWTVGDLPNNAPATTAYLAVEGLPVGASAFQYTPPQDTNTPYILFVHGWNMETWEKDRFAETAFKRLYWQGYHGRFGSFRWPTYYDFPLGSWSWQAVSLRNFDNSEFNAWRSGVGLLNKLNDLNAQYPNNVYLIAHSMGNVVAGEALRLAGTNQAINTYAALQGAIASHTYDSATPTRPLTLLGVNWDSGTPDRYANYYASNAPSYFNGSAGAGTYVNFFNTNDWALTTLWEPDQDFKPDNGLNYPGYFYSSSSGFYKIAGSTISLNFPGDTYEIFSFCDEARSHALGAQVNVGGKFSGNQVELDTSPYNLKNNHIFHSGEFRSDNAQRAAFWNAVLVQMKLK